MYITMKADEITMLYHLYEIHAIVKIIPRLQQGINILYYYCNY